MLAPPRATRPFPIPARAPYHVPMRTNSFGAWPKRIPRFLREARKRPRGRGDSLFGKPPRGGAPSADPVGAVTGPR